MSRNAWLRARALFVIPLLLASACTPIVKPSVSEVAALQSPAPTDAPTPEPTPAPTPTPTPSPTPEPTPKITAEWYVERTEQMRHYMEEYGGYTGEALDARVRAMEIDPDRPMVALTFDDGPVEGITDRIVEILRQYDARATFFVRGSRFAYDATPGLLRMILGEGNELGNHTWKHVNLTEVDAGTAYQNIKNTNAAVYEATGYTMHLLRPPGGRTNGNVSSIAGHCEMAVVRWTQSGNVHEKDPAKIAENVFCQIVNGKQLEDGDIVLLHDTKERMIEAVEIAVPKLVAEGYQLVTVGELLQCGSAGIVYGMKYNSREPVS